MLLLLGRPVARKVLDVALSLLLLYPGVELPGLLAGGELLPYPGLDLLQRLGPFGVDLRHLDEVVSELGLDRADDLAFFGAEGGILETLDGLSLAQAAE